MTLFLLMVKQPTKQTSFFFNNFLEGIKHTRVVISLPSQKNPQECEGREGT